ncbi:MAG TPA: acyl-CoA thioesterase domain-containing protein [Ilumatobacteraceae bacterium]|nr:acyl-CoA thioesterase domain-containing protein [Ilumatobacteraceae bacterium]
MPTRKIHDIEFSELLQLEPHGPDTYVGIAARYPWGGRLFGGQVVAQALRAAARTIDADRAAHSLHSYFIRPGAAEEPIRYEVERLRDGRSFSTRQVVARQSAGAILNLSVSFHVMEDEADVPVATLPPGLPGPDDPSVLDHSWAGLLQRKATFLEDGTMGYWIRLDADMGDDPADHQCALAFMSDAAPSRAARSSHPDFAGDTADRRLFQGASLDHSVWFERPTDPSQWHWFATRSHGVNRGRGLVTGDVIRHDGLQVATIAQEVLVRRRRDA